MPSTFLCPGCGHSVNSWATVGEKVICPGCGKSLGLILPAEPAPVRPAVPGASAGDPGDVVDIGADRGSARSVSLRRHHPVRPWIPAVAILSAALLIFGVIVAAMVSRSSAKSNPAEADAGWDVAHRPDIRSLKFEAESKALSGDLRGSYASYQALEKLIGSNSITDPETAELVRSAKAGEERVYQLLLSEKSAGRDSGNADTSAAHGGDPSNDVRLPSVASSNLPDDPVQSAVASVSQETGQPGPTDPAARPVQIAPAPVVQPPPGGLQGNPTVPQAVALPGHLADQRIGQSLDAGITFLISRFNNGQIVDGRAADDVRHQGLDALCVYALLHASQGSADPRLNIHGTFMVQLLANLKAFPMAGRDPLKPMAPAVYAHSLRAAALAVYNRPEDHKQLQEDVNWLVNASMNGAYTYDDRYAAHPSPGGRSPGASGSAVPVAPAVPIGGSEIAAPTSNPRPVTVAGEAPTPVADPLLNTLPTSAPAGDFSNPAASSPGPAVVVVSTPSADVPNQSVTTAGNSVPDSGPGPGAVVTIPAGYGQPNGVQPLVPNIITAGGTAGHGPVNAVRSAGRVPPNSAAHSSTAITPVITASGGSSPASGTSTPAVASSDGTTPPPTAGTGATSKGQTPAPSPAPSPVRQAGSGGGGGGGGTGPTGPVLARTTPGPFSPIGPGAMPGPLAPTEPNLVRTMPGPMVRTMPSLERTMPGPLVPTEPTLARTMPGPLVPTEPSLPRTVPGSLVPTEPSLPRTTPGSTAQTVPGPHTSGGSRGVASTSGGSLPRSGTPHVGPSTNYIPLTTSFGVPIYLPLQAPTDNPTPAPIPLQSNSVPAPIDPGSAPTVVVPTGIPPATAVPDGSAPAGVTPASAVPAAAVPNAAVPAVPQAAPDSSGMIVPQLTPQSSAGGDGSLTQVATASGQTPDPATASNLADLPQPTDSQPLPAPGGIIVYRPGPRQAPVGPSRRPVAPSAGSTPATPGSGASSAPWVLVGVQEHDVKTANGKTVETGSVTVNGKTVETQTGTAASGSVSVPIATPHGGAVATETWGVGRDGQPVSSVSITRDPGAWGTPPPVTPATVAQADNAGRAGQIGLTVPPQSANARPVDNPGGPVVVLYAPSGTASGPPTPTPTPMPLQSSQPAATPVPAAAPIVASGPAAVQPIAQPLAAPAGAPTTQPISSGLENSPAPTTQPAAGNNVCAVSIVESKTKGADGVTVQTGTVTVNGVVIQKQSNSTPSGAVSVQFQTPYGVATAVESWSNPASGPGVSAGITPPAGAAFQIPAGTTMRPGEVIGRIIALPAGTNAGPAASDEPSVAPPLETPTKPFGSNVSAGNDAYAAPATPAVPDSSVSSFLPDTPVPQPTLPTPEAYTNRPPSVVIVPAGASSGRRGPSRNVGGGPSASVTARTGPNSSAGPITSTTSGTAGVSGGTTESSTVTYNGRVIEHQSGNAPSGSISVPVQTDHGVVVASGSWSTGPGGSAGGSSGSASPAAPNRGPAGPHPAGYIPATPDNHGPLSVWYGNQPNPAPAAPAQAPPQSASMVPSAAPPQPAAPNPSGNLIAARPNNPPPSPFTNNNRNNTYLTPQQPNDPAAILNDPTLVRQLTQVQNGQGLWDNSNSQYGLLGVWSGAEAGCEVPNAYWGTVEKHWTSCELPTGQWCYSAFDPDPTLSMSCAGTASLLVCHEWMDWPAGGTRVGRQPYSPALAQGLKYLETGNNITNIVTPDLKYLGYTAYGIERTALASGFKYFGAHDWYAEMAAQLMPYQFPTGAWGNASDGTDSAEVNTAYMVLFLSRGRHPILMNKLRFEPYWDNRPKDVANLAKYAGIELERPFNWQVVSADRPWSDWTDSPVLYIASHRPPTLSDADCQKLKSFAEAGGLIFTHSDSNSSGFNDWVQQLQKRLWPQYDLKPIPRDSAVYSSNYHLGGDKRVPNLKGISNGSRYLLIHCPTDSLSAQWQDAATSQKAEFQMGINLFVYAAGHASFRNRLDSPFIPEPTVPATASVKAARLKYDGNWDPEPYAWTRFGRYMQWTVGTAIDLAPVDLAALGELKPADRPVAVLTGNAAVTFTDAQAAAVAAYVKSGGTILIDSTGGNADFARSAQALISKAIPETALTDVAATDPLIAGGSPLLDPLPRPLGRPYNTDAQIKTVPIQMIHTPGTGRVIFTPLDLTTGLLGTNTWGIAGYDPEYAQKLVKNVVETAGTP